MNEDMSSKGIALATINRALARVGLVLVVAHWDGKGERTPTRLWVERLATFLARCEASTVPEEPLEAAKQGALLQAGISVFHYVQEVPTPDGSTLTTIDLDDPSGIPGVPPIRYQEGG